MVYQLNAEKILAARNSKLLFELTAFKFIIDVIELNEEEGEPLYENRNQLKVNYCRKKCFIKNDAVNIVQSIVPSLEKRY